MGRLSVSLTDDRLGGVYDLPPTCILRVTLLPSPTPKLRSSPHLRRFRSGRGP